MMYNNWIGNVFLVVYDLLLILKNFIEGKNCKWKQEKYL